MPAESSDGNIRILAKIDGLFCIKYDLSKDIIRISEFLIVSQYDTDRYIAALRPIVVEMRSRCDRLLLLADLRDAPIRSQAAVDSLRLTNQGLYSFGDRVALIVSSKLMTIQLKRNIIPEYQKIFTTEDQAENWLIS